MSSTRRREKATRAGTAKLTLNAKAYSRPDIFERERREVFARAWMIIGHVAEVREPGSFTTGEIGGEPVPGTAHRHRIGAAAGEHALADPTHVGAPALEPHPPAFVREAPRALGEPSRRGEHP